MDWVSANIWTIKFTVALFKVVESYGERDGLNSTTDKY